MNIEGKKGVHTGASSRYECKYTRPVASNTSQQKCKTTKRKKMKRCLRTLSAAK